MCRILINPDHEGFLIFEKDETNVYIDQIIDHSLSLQKSRLTFIAHKLPLCNKGEWQAPDIGFIIYGDSV